jgi:transcriptional regulator with XRE-family HTH domain
VSIVNINNLKQIREIYGATQEQIARALSVNRVTVANWENGSTMASSANREKMSMYYGIGPEYFYEQELTDQVKQMIRQTAEKEQDIVSQSNGKENKPEDFHEMFEAVSFDEVMRDYMMFTKLLLAKADDADLDTLRTALTINIKMGKRLAAIVSVREEEEENGDIPLAQLMDSI